MNILINCYGVLNGENNGKLFSYIKYMRCILGFVGRIFSLVKKVLATIAI